MILGRRWRRPRSLGVGGPGQRFTWNARPTDVVIDHDLLRPAKSRDDVAFSWWSTCHLLPLFLDRLKILAREGLTSAPRRSRSSRT